MANKRCARAMPCRASVCNTTTDSSHVNNAFSSLGSSAMPMPPIDFRLSVFEQSRRAAIMRRSTDLKELRRLQPVVFLLHVFRLLGVWLRHDFLQFSQQRVVPRSCLLIRRHNQPLPQTVFWVDELHLTRKLLTRARLSERFPFCEPL